MNEMMKWLREVSVCPKCGKSKLRLAVGGRGHGTGQPGVRTATGIYEPFDPERHCRCEAGVQAERRKKVRHCAVLQKHEGSLGIAFWACRVYGGCKLTIEEHNTLFPMREIASYYGVTGPSGPSSPETHLPQPGHLRTRACSRTGTGPPHPAAACGSPRDLPRPGDPVVGSAEVAEGEARGDSRPGGLLG